MSGIFINGLGVYLPKQIISNADLEKLVETTDEWITSRTGIKSRHNGNSFRKGFLFICIITVFKAFYNENFRSRDFFTET